MHLRRSSDGTAPTTTVTDPVAAAVWDGLPATPAVEPLIKAPRAADLVTTTSTTPDHDHPRAA